MLNNAANAGEPFTQLLNAQHKRGLPNRKILKRRKLFQDAYVSVNNRINEINDLIPMVFEKNDRKRHVSRCYEIATDHKWWQATSGQYCSGVVAERGPIV